MPPAARRLIRADDIALTHLRRSGFTGKVRVSSRESDPSPWPVMDPVLPHVITEIRRSTKSAPWTDWLVDWLIACLKGLPEVTDVRPTVPGTVQVVWRGH